MVIRRVLLSSFILTVTVGITACGSKSSGSDETVTTVAPTPFSISGRLIDGYLRQATVWVDLNNNQRLDAGEPSMTTGVGGRYEFSVETLASFPEAKNAPLMAHVLPGITLDEDHIVKNGDTEDTSQALVDRAYVLMAPPGSNNITPFSTLMKKEWDQTQKDERIKDEFKRLDDAHVRLRNRLGISGDLLQDYIASGDVRMRAYARALVMTLQQELARQGYSPSNALAGLNDLNVDLLNHLLEALLLEGRQVLEQVDAAVKRLPQPEDPKAPRRSYLELLANMADVRLPSLEQAFSAPSVRRHVQWFTGLKALADQHPSPLCSAVADQQIYCTGWTSGEVPVNSLQSVAQTTYRYTLTGKPIVMRVDGWLNVGLDLEATPSILPEPRFRLNYFGDAERNIPLEATDGRTNFSIENRFALGRLASYRVLLEKHNTQFNELATLAKGINNEAIYDDQDRLQRINFGAVSLGRNIRINYPKDQQRPAQRFETPAVDGGGRSDVYTYTYDDNDRLSHVRHHVVATPAASEKVPDSGIQVNVELNNPSHRDIARATYDYDDLNRITSVCTRLTPDPVPTDATPPPPAPKLNWCWHSEYQTLADGRTAVQYQYLELVSGTDAPLKRAGGGQIPVIAVYHYDSLPNALH
jgi:hypothetical protein